MILAGPWHERIETVRHAAGWTRPDAFKWFGVSEFRMKRILCGGRPTIDFVRRLERFEGLYAEDIAALKAGHIVIFKSGWKEHRADFRIAPKRPSREEMVFLEGDAQGARRSE